MFYKLLKNVRDSIEGILMGGIGVRLNGVMGIMLVR